MSRKHLPSNIDDIPHLNYMRQCFENPVTLCLCGVVLCVLSQGTESVIHIMNQACALTEMVEIFGFSDQASPGKKSSPHWKPLCVPKNQRHVSLLSSQHAKKFDCAIADCILLRPGR